MVELRRLTAALQFLDDSKLCTTIARKTLCYFDTYAAAETGRIIPEERHARVSSRFSRVTRVIVLENDLSPDFEVILFISK